MTQRTDHAWNAIWFPLGFGVVLQIAGYWLAAANRSGTKTVGHLLADGSTVEHTGNRLAVDIGLIVGGIGSAVVLVALVTLAVVNALRIHAAERT